MSRLCWYLSLAYSLDLARNLVVEDLADRHARIDAHRLDGEHLQRPVAAEADVAEAGGDVDEQSQPADRRSSFDHGHQIVRLGPLDRAAEIQLIRAEHEARSGNHVRRTRLPFRMSSTTSSYVMISSCSVRL